MNTKIDIDVTESILKAYSRRNKDQSRVYGILMGTIEGKETYHIKNCIHGYIYESKEDTQSQQGIEVSLLIKNI